MPIPRFEPERTALLVVDVQEKLLPLIEGAARVERQCVQLIRGCTAVGVPVIATEQYPKGLGPTVAGIRAALPPGTHIESKMKFSACVEGVRRKLQEWGSTHILVCGIETHVCISQTVLDLMDAGFVVGIVEDAVGSRSPSDHAVGLRRMEHAAAVPVSVEMALFELVHEAGTDRFKAMLPIVKGPRG
jgi:nicotinamidase-related amidase